MQFASSRTTVVGKAAVCNPGIATVHGNLRDEKAEKLRGRWQVSDMHQLNMNAKETERERKRKVLSVSRKYPGSISLYNSINRGWFKASRGQP